MLLPDRGRDVRKAFYFRRERRQWGSGFVRGVGANVGGIASSVAHDTHGLLVLGFDENDMALAGNSVLAFGGGIVLVDRGRMVFEFKLPYGERCPISP